jgi:hypothetical protein
MLNANLSKPWTTHMGVLVKVLAMSSGDVVELGAGPFSTPLLHWVCKDMRRKLISYETNPEYYQYARQFRSYFHKIVFIEDWDTMDTITRRGVVFVDHHPMPRRGVEAIRFKDSADYVVMHDTELAKYYPGVDQHFKNIYIWRDCRPWVTVASNIKDLSELK